MAKNNRARENYDLRSIAADVMVQHGLLPEFSLAATAEAGPLTRPSDERGPDIRDARALPWVSIDNDDSLDLDQLSVSQPAEDGNIRILVAVADVDSLVRKDSAIDEHARTNTTSVYTAARIFPMLPEKLSTDLTSLNQGEERLAVVVDMTVDARGKVVSDAIYRAIVRNQAKLAYNGVAAWLDGNGEAPAALGRAPGLDEQLRVQDRVAHAMRARRQECGALRLETQEARAVFEGDVLVDMRPDPRNRAKDLIEDFMIGANTATATFLEKKKFPSIRRVLRTPKRWDRIVRVAADLGTRLPEVADAAALDNFLDARRQADPERFPDLSLTIVKLLGSGEYALDLPGEEPEGHFGLALRDYAHSTAPNRRFPDLITQRLLKAALAGRPVPYSNDELAALAGHCTLQEDNAEKVERQVRKSAAALLLTSRIGQRFDGIVTGASDKGTWVRVTGPAAEGKVVRGYEGLDVGDHARVELVRTDVRKGFIDFVAVPER